MKYPKYITSHNIKYCALSFGNVLCGDAIVSAVISLSCMCFPVRVENLELLKYLVGSYVEGCLFATRRLVAKLVDSCQTIMLLITTLGSCCPIDRPLYTGIGNSQWCQPSILAFKLISIWTKGCLPSIVLCCYWNQNCVSYPYMQWNHVIMNDDMVVSLFHWAYELLCSTYLWRSTGDSMLSSTYWYICKRDLLCIDRCTYMLSLNDGVLFGMWMV